MSVPPTLEGLLEEKYKVLPSRLKLGLLFENDLSLNGKEEGVPQESPFLVALKRYTWLYFAFAFLSLGENCFSL